MKVTKKIFSHGGSDAVNLPKEFTRKLSSAEVCIEVFEDQIVIQGKPELDTIEADPLFGVFLQAIANDALKHPEKLKDLNKAYKELDGLLEGVPLDEEE